MGNGVGLLLDGVRPTAPVYTGLPGRLGGEVTLLLAQVNPDNSNLSPGELSQFGLSDLTLARDAHQKRFTPYAAYAAGGKTLFHNAFFAYA